jgi:hypothetical protein
MKNNIRLFNKTLFNRVNSLRRGHIYPGLGCLECMNKACLNAIGNNPKDDLKRPCKDYMLK